MSEQDNHAGWLAFWTYVTALAVTMIAFMVIATAYESRAERNGIVGRGIGYAVVEQYDTSWVTTDPSWNPVVDPDGCGCLPLPEAAPGGGR